MGCFLGGVHDSSPKLLCPFHIWLPLPSTSRESKTDARPRALQYSAPLPIHSQVGRHREGWFLNAKPLRQSKISFGRTS